MIVTPSFARRVTGATNIRPTTKFGSVTDVTPFTVRAVMKWISARTVGRLFVAGVVRSVVVSFVGVGCVRIVPLLVEGTFLCVCVFFLLGFMGFYLQRLYI